MFPEKMPEGAWYETLKLDVLCFALRIHKTSSLPVLEGESAENVHDVAAALSQHYAHIGKTLSNLVK